MAVNLGSATIWAIFPEICLVILGAIVLVFDLELKEHRRLLGWVTAIGLTLTGILAAIFSQPGNQPGLVFGGMLRYDWLAFYFRLIFLGGAAITALFAMDVDELGQRGEFYLLMLASTLGMTLMAGAADLVMLYLAIETTSIPLYAMAGFLPRDRKSTEAGFKYILFGAMTSAVMLYSFSLIYWFTGTTQIYTIESLLTQGGVSSITLVVLVMMALVGLGFKISAVPFHFWAPDVYEGSPTPVAGFLSTASKAAGFAVIMRVLFIAFKTIVPSWGIILAIMATASMIVGNTLALANQKNIKRLLAYSSIAQAGYILIGVATYTFLGYAGSSYYLVSYLVTNLAAFGVIEVVGKANHSYEVKDFAGLSRRSPGVALVFLVALLSLAGIPPFGGFVGKVLVFSSAILNPEFIWLAVLGILNSIIGLYYYLVILKVVYMDRSENEAQPVPLTPAWRTAIAVCLVGIVSLGVVIAPLFNAAVKVVLGIQ